MGLVYAMAIFMSWLAILLLATRLEIGQVGFGVIVAFVFLKAFLNTGLFIVAHDSMHNTLSPGWPLANKSVGAIALLVYAGLDFSSCQRKHLLHHKSPESSVDPDYRPYAKANYLNWFMAFLRSYLSSRSIFFLFSGWVALCSISKSSCESVAVFSVLPLILSSLQLFTFGVWMPHRPGGENDAPTPRSSNLPPLIALIACYNFGYHHEHHENPFIPWYVLPRFAMMKP